MIRIKEKFPEDTSSFLAVNVQPPTLTERIGDYSQEIFTTLGVLGLASGGALFMSWSLIAGLGALGTITYLFYIANSEKNVEIEIDIKSPYVKQLIKSVKNADSRNSSKDIDFKLDILKTLHFYGTQKYRLHDLELLTLNNSIIDLLTFQKKMNSKDFVFKEPEFIEIYDVKEDKSEIERISQVQTPITFKNDGNRCYLNSSIQALFASPEFRTWVRNPYDLHKRLHSEWTEYKSGKTNAAIWNESVCQYFAGTEVQQLLIKILDKIETGKGSCEQELSQIRKLLFSGSLHPEFKGFEHQQCDAKSVFEALISLYNQNISLSEIHHGKNVDGESASSKNPPDFVPFLRLGFEKNSTASFQDLINAEFSERLNNDYRKFEREGKKNLEVIEFTSKSIIDLVKGTPPKMLMIQLKRFQYLSKSVKSVKLDDYIEFPKDFIVDLKCAFDKEQLKKGQSTQYTLRSVVIHEGDLNAGHYIAHVRYDDKWFRCDDQKKKIKPLKEEQVDPGMGYMLVLDLKE